MTTLSVCPELAKYLEDKRKEKGVTSVGSYWGIREVIVQANSFHAIDTKFFISDDKLKEILDSNPKLKSAQVLWEMMK